MITLKNKKVTILASAVSLLLSILGLRPGISWAAEPSEFFKGAVAKIIVPFAPGGGVDIRTRALAPFFEKHSGARILVENMPGAGGYVAVGHLYNKAKPDGLTLCSFFGSGVFLAEELGQKEAIWKLEKLSYIARITKNWGGPLMVGRKSSIQNLGDLLKTKREIKAAVVDPTVPGSLHLTLIAEALGLNLKIVSGFPGGKECAMAVMRGEIEMTSNPVAGFEDAFKKGDLRALAVLDNIPASLPADLPRLSDLPLSKERKKYLDLSLGVSDLGSVIAAPPGVPKERVQFLEDALMKTLNEPEVRKFFEVRGDNYAPLSGSKYLSVIKEMKKTVAEIGIKELDHILFKKYY